MNACLFVRALNFEFNAHLHICTHTHIYQHVPTMRIPCVSRELEDMLIQKPASAHACAHVIFPYLLASLPPSFPWSVVAA